VHFDLQADPSIEPMAMLRPVATRVPPAPRPAVIQPRFRLQTDAGLGPTWPLVAQMAETRAWRDRFSPLVQMYSRRMHRSAAARLLAAEILSSAFLARCDEGRGERPATEDVRLLRALDAVDREPSRRWTVEGLRRRSGLGESRFRLIFTRATGLSPRAWIEGKRVERAARLLLESAKPIADIARDCGYEDPFHFSRAFRRVMGLSPRAYRGR
jgi:AraC-like DNA-binding protein